MYSDFDELSSKEKDATKINVKIEDQNGNPLYFYDKVAIIDISGPGKLLGDRLRIFKGGYASFYIETLNIPGDIIINISVEDEIIENKKITLKVK